MISPIKIIHLEGVGADAGLIMEALNKGGLPHEYLWVRNAFDFEKQLVTFCPEVILSDATLFFQDVKKDSIPYTLSGLTIPLILIADSYSEKLDLELAKSGAIDYFFKDRLQRLSLAILNAANTSRKEKEFLEKQVEVVGAEQKSAEDLLQKSEANLRTIFDNTNVSYVLSDKKFRIISFNSAAVITYSNEFKTIIKEGDNLLNFLPDDRKTESRERFERVLKGEKINYELSLDQPDGTTSWYNVNMFAVRDEIQNLLGFIISSENITHRKSIELERSKMLSDIVRHNKDLEQFAYIISHNLRSPVANILGLSALLENSPDMDKLSFDKCMSGLTASVKKLDEVIVDLNYILQTRREINERKEMVSFSELINDIKTSISSQIEKENITVNTNFIVNKFFTLKSYLYSIFFNLIYNSIKYRNPAKEAIINVQSKKINNKIVLEFRDNGLGIDLEAQGHIIFGLYKKFHKHIEGKGMGLYMVKTQVEILGGKISVASIVNKGTTFTIEFEE